MSADTFTEVTSRGWFSRVGGAIKGLFIGLIMIVAGAVLLWINEGRAVKTAKALREGAAVVVSVNAATVDAAQEGKLVHMTGDAATSEQLSDPDFGITATAIALRRSVEMYQWKESSHSKTTKKLGGGEETVTTYTYDRAWSPAAIASTDFKQPDGHANPGALPIPEQTWRAGQVTLGAFTLSPGLVGQMSDFVPIPVTDASSVRLPAGRFAGVHLSGSGLFLGADPAKPQVGDLRVSFSQVRPATVSLVARQRGSSFEPYLTTVGRELEMLVVGTSSAEAMFKSEEASNTLLTWILRAAGFILIFIGFAAVFKPLSVLADVVPFIGNLVGFGTGIVAFLLALVLSLVVIAIAWIVYRPVLAIGLLALALGAVVLLARRKKPAPAPQVSPRPGT
jgi:hypothetical protein